MLHAVRLADSIIDELDEAFGVTLDRSPARIHQSTESAVFRCRDVVVRVGPTWRTDAEVEWCNEVALAAADVVAECVAPIVRPDGSTVVRIDDRPVSLWPFVTSDDDTALPPAHAADLLARIHVALSMRPWPARPASGRAPAPTPELADRDLDTWLAIFERDHTETTALHGDFTPRNVLVVDGRAVGVIDWDDAVVGPPERELAWAAWEWTGDLSAAVAFVDAYREAGGPARRIGEHDLRQLVREHVRLLAGRGDLSTARLQAFSNLRVRSGP
jgi:Ser/Thr protein kinase RdoA (MazF antagonist)